MNEVFLFTLTFIITAKYIVSLNKNNNQQQLSSSTIQQHFDIYDSNEIQIPIDNLYTTTHLSNSNIMNITLMFPEIINSIYVGCAYTLNNITIAYSKNNTNFHNANITKHPNSTSKYYFHTTTPIKYLSITINSNNNKPCSIILFKLKYTIVTITNALLSEYCLTIPNTLLYTFPNTLPLITAKCNSITDNRNIFIMWHNGYITPFNNPSKCIAHEGKDQSQITIQNCIELLEYNDNRYLWLYNEQNYFLSPKTSDTVCMSISINNNSDYTSFVNKQHIKYVNSSSTLNNYDIENVIDYSNINTFWLSDASQKELNTNSVVIKFLFEFHVALRSITIHWKFKATLFKVLAIYNDSIRKEVKLVTKEENDTVSTVYLMNEDVIGIVLQLYESETKIRNVNVYGIYKVYFNFQGHYVVKSNECKDIERNKWYFRKINNVESKSFIVNESNYNKPTFHMLFRDEREKVYTYVNHKLNHIKNESKYINATVNNLYLQLMNYITNNKKYYKVKANEEFIAKSCDEIKSKFNSSENGFYNIKTHCMETPLQMYCDFINNNDYYLLYVDNNEINDIMNMDKQCAKVGLEPINKQTLTKKSVHTIEHFLQMHNLNNFINNNHFLLNEYIVPLSLYDNVNDINNIITPNNTTIAELNNLFQLTNNHISPISISDTFVLYFSISYLTNIFTLTYSPYLNTFPSFNRNILGYICTTNNPIHNKFKPTIIQCNTKLSDIPVSFVSNKQLLSCPQHCLSSFNSSFPYEVYYNNKHRSYLNISHLCISAIHSGIISNNYGGNFFIISVKGEEHYDVNEHNGVIASYYVNHFNHFGFVIEQHLQECPTLAKQQNMDYKMYKNFSQFNEMFYGLNSNQRNINSLWALVNNAKQLLHLKERSVTHKENKQLCKQNYSFYETFEFENIEHNYICLGNINTKWEYILSQSKHKLIRKVALDKFIYGSYLFIKHAVFDDFKFCVSLSIPIQSFKTPNSDLYLRLYFLYENATTHYYYQVNRTSHSLWSLHNEQTLLLNIIYGYTHDILMCDKITNITVIKTKSEVTVYNDNINIITAKVFNKNAKGKLGFGGSVPIIYFYNIEGVHIYN